MFSNQIKLCLEAGNYCTFLKEKKYDFFLHEFIISGGFNGNLSVICGSPLATELPITTASTTTPTMITTPSTASSRLSSVVSSTESTVTIENDVNVIESTGTTMSEENTCICGRKDEVTGNYMHHFQNI